MFWGIELYVRSCDLEGSPAIWKVHPSKYYHMWIIDFINILKHVSVVIDCDKDLFSQKILLYCNTQQLHIKILILL